MGLKLFKRLQKLAYDLLFLCGCGVCVYGLWLAWRPLGFIVGGIVLAAIGFLSAYNLARPAESEE